MKEIFKKPLNPTSKVLMNFEKETERKTKNSKATSKPWRSETKGIYAATAFASKQMAKRADTLDVSTKKNKIMAQDDRMNLLDDIENDMDSRLDMSLRFNMMHSKDAEAVKHSYTEQHQAVDDQISHTKSADAGKKRSKANNTRNRMARNRPFRSFPRSRSPSPQSKSPATPVGLSPWRKLQAIGKTGRRLQMIRRPQR